MGSLGGREGQENNLAKVQGGALREGDPPRSAHLGHGPGAKVEGSKAPYTLPGQSLPAHREPGCPARRGRVRCLGYKSPSKRKKRNLNLL